MSKFDEFCAPAGALDQAASLPTPATSPEAGKPDEFGSPALPVLKSGGALGLIVLVAEDNPLNQYVMRSILQVLGCLSQVVENGSAAVTSVQRGYFDAVLMDCFMPGMDGWTATEEIRKWERSQPAADRTHILAVTAADLPGQLERCREVGMDGVLVKPFTMDQIRSHLTALASSGTLEQREQAGVRSQLAELARCIGNASAARLVRTFVSQLPVRLAELRQKANEKDAAALSRCAHSLKGTCATFGAVRCAALARQLETASRQTVPTNLETYLNALELAVARSTPAFEALLTRIG